MAGLINESKYQAMKSELGDVVNIFFDDTKNSDQTIQLITELAGVAIAVQGLGEVPDHKDKAKIIGQILLELGTEITHDMVVGDPEVL